MGGKGKERGDGFGERRRREGASEVQILRCRSFRGKRFLDGTRGRGRRFDYELRKNERLMLCWRWGRTWTID